MNSENGNWIKLYRQITESKIWEVKPSSWVVIWIYILLKVSFVDNNSYKKGEAHFRSAEHEALPFDITNDIWYRCLSWLEEEGMIKRRKVWRGEIITVLNYEKYQNNLSSENCKTGLDPNHIQTIQPNTNEAEEVRQSDTPKSYPNHIQIIPSTNSDKMQAQDPLKNIRIKEVNNIKNNNSPNLDFSDSDFFLKEKEKDKDTSIGGGANIHSETEDAELEKKIARFYAIFEKVMETKYQVGYRVSYRPYAILLVKQYSLEDIEKGLRLLKQKMQKENPSNWRNFVKPSSLVKMIDDLLAEQEPKEEEVRNYGW